MKTFEEATKNIRDYIELSKEIKDIVYQKLGIEFFHSICDMCSRKKCPIRDHLVESDNICKCNYFTTIKEEAVNED